MRLIDKDGRLVTEDGKHIDENGNFIKWEEDGTSTKVDPTGRAVNAAGDFDFEHSPLLDDEDNVIDESVYDESKPKPKPKPKRGRKKAVKSETSESPEEAVAESDN